MSVFQISRNRRLARDFERYANNSFALPWGHESCAAVAAKARRGRLIGDPGPADQRLAAKGARSSYLTSGQPPSASGRNASAAGVERMNL
jgi:hypothetical protein